MKFKTTKIVIVSVIFACAILLILTPPKNIDQVGEINMIGNDYTNLLIGGKVAKQGNTIYFSDSNKAGLFNCISKYDLNTNKVKSLKTFVIIPTELCVTGDYIFFKKSAAFAAESPLYRMNTNGKKCKSIISESINRYNIHSNKIYYTVISDVGLFQCDIDGKNKKRIIQDDVNEFVICGDVIYYTQKNSIRRFNLTNGSNVVVVNSEGYSLYHLTNDNDDLFYVKTDDADCEKEFFVRNSLKNNTETLLYAGKCGFIHTISNVVVFRGENEYYCLNLDDLTLSSFEEKYNVEQDITEIYIFDSECFYFVNVEGQNKLIRQSLNSKESFVISG